MKRWWRWVGRLVVTAAVIYFVGHSLSLSWRQLWTERPAIRLDPLWLGLSVLSVALTSVVQIESWRQMLRGWGQSLRRPVAARIWFLANIGRYVPGKVWSVAGMLVMAQEAGVAGWAAAASAVAIQAVGIGTAVALIIATATATSSPLGLLAAAVAALGTVLVLAWEFATSRIARVVPRMDQLRPLPLPDLLGSAGLTLAGWITYGLALWSLARGLGLPGNLSIASASGAFACGYIAGLLALFAPGGVGVREGFLMALLAPALGASGALVLSLASRVELTILEAAFGVAALAWKPPSKETAALDP